MPRAAFTIDGIQGLTADLDQYTESLRIRLVAATTATRLAVIADAQARAPRDQGDLVAAIQGQGAGLIQRVGLVDEDLVRRGGHNTAHRNPSVYGVWYEYGFKTRNIAAHAFMGPAAEAEAERHVDRLTDAINEAGT